MTVVAIVCGVILGVTGLLCLIRIVRGPSMLDRAAATDVFVAASVAAVGVIATLERSTTILPVLLALSLVGFLGSVSIARFAAHDTGSAPQVEENP